MEGDRMALWSNSFLMLAITLVLVALTFSLS